MKPICSAKLLSTTFIHSAVIALPFFICLTRTIATTEGTAYKTQQLNCWWVSKGICLFPFLCLYLLPLHFYLPVLPPNCANNLIAPPSGWQKVSKTFPLGLFVVFEKGVHLYMGAASIGVLVFGFHRFIQYGAKYILLTYSTFATFAGCSLL